MRISTRGKNAIKLMLDLATYNHGEPVRLKDIAKRQNISEKYLEQIVAVLHKAALVKSIRGAHGGYVLNQMPEKYTVGQILKAVEGICRRQTVLVKMELYAKIKLHASVIGYGRNWIRLSMMY